MIARILFKRDMRKIVRKLSDLQMSLFYSKLSMNQETWKDLTNGIMDIVNCLGGEYANGLFSYNTIQAFMEDQSK